MNNGNLKGNTGKALPKARRRSFLIVSLLLIPLLSGCVAVAIGAVAGGAAGYYVYHEENNSSPQGTNTQH